MPRRAARAAGRIALAISCVGSTGSVATDAPPAAGEVTRLTHGEARNRTPMVSPDGSRIVFTSNRSGGWQVWTMPAAGGEPVQHTFGEKPVGWPTWTGDGSAILYESAGEVLRLELSSGKTTPLVALDQPCFRPLLGPDGAGLLFDLFQGSPGANHDVHVLDLASGDLKQLTSDPGYDSDARWSPDGRSIVFHSDRGGERFHHQVWVMASDGSEQRRLTSGPAVNAYPTWSPNGRCVVHTTESDANRDLRVIDLAGGWERRLTTYEGFDGDPVWDPAGGSLLFSTGLFGGQELARLRLDSEVVARCEG